MCIWGICSPNRVTVFSHRNDRATSIKNWPSSFKWMRQRGGSCCVAGRAQTPLCSATKRSPAFVQAVYSCEKRNSYGPQRDRWRVRQRAEQRAGHMLRLFASLRGRSRGCTTELLLASQALLTLFWKTLVKIGEMVVIGLFIGGCRITER